MRINYILRSYRFDEDLIKKLNLLDKYSIVESRFVRQAINEKLQRDLPKLKIKQRVNSLKYVILSEYEYLVLL